MLKGTNITISNKITLSRIILAFIFMYFLYTDFCASKIIALSIFILASTTDFFDGFLARKREEITEFGKFLDPIADKILVFVAFLSFIDLNLVYAWMIIVILSRDFIINGLRFIAAKKGVVLSSNQLAKHKTFSQMFAIFIILSGLAIKDIVLDIFNTWTSFYQSIFETIIFILMIIVVILSLFSGFMYLFANRNIFIKERNV